ncbi:MAG: GGDEF domain-containing protein [Deltaproteobacteria bacterium]|nr:GGDEF domain-containing protein [Deltaproteobacteria bacterium]
MPPPRHNRSPARGVRRHSARLLAPAYILLLSLLRIRYAGGVPLAIAAAAGVLAFAYVLGAYLVARKRDDRVPETEGCLIWGGAAAMALHAAFPPVAGSRTVPAAIGFGLGVSLPLRYSIPCAACAAAWLAAIPGPFPAESLPVAAMSILSFAAGAGGRSHRLRRPPEEESAKAAIARSRSVVLPWEEPPEGGRRSEGETTEEGALMRRGLEIREDIRRALEGVLPLTGATHAAYLWPSRSPGVARHDGFLVSRGRDLPRDFSVPETYVPVREATVFRRPFFETGEEAERYSPRISAESGATKGIAAVPVFREDAVEGVLLAIREDEEPWVDPVLPLLGLVAYFIGRDIERTRALHREERYLLREDWYHKMVRKMAQMGESGSDAEGAKPRSRRERVYAEAVGQVRRQVGAGRVLLVGTSDGGRNGWLTWEETESFSGGSDQPQLLGDSYVGWVIRHGSQRIFSGEQGRPRNQGVRPSAGEKPGERSYLVLPVAGVGGFRGAVVCAHESAGRFGKAHAEVVRDVTEVMQMGLSHVEHLETLTRRATTDGLTGLPNRKSFLDRLSSELERLDGRHPCAVVMLDLDHFKRINDTYGHPFGDEVLKRVSGVIAKAVRKGDAAGRYGGEEFVLYLHMTDPERAQEAAERFRRMIRQTKFLHEGREVAVTASLGVSCAPIHGKGAGELLKRADEALYLSKERGRDRVTVYPG